MEKFETINSRENLELSRRKIVKLLRDLEVVSKTEGSLGDYGFDYASEDAKKKLLEEVGVYKLSNGYKIEIKASENFQSARLINDKNEELLSEGIEISLSSKFDSIEAEALIKKLEKEDPEKLEELNFNEDSRLYWIRYKKGDMILVERATKMMKEKLAREEYEKLREIKKTNHLSVSSNKFHEEYDSVLSSLLRNTTNLSKAVVIINEQRLGEKDLHPGALYHLSDKVKDAFLYVISDNLNWIELQDKNSPDAKETLKNIFEEIFKKDLTIVLNAEISKRLLVLMSPYLKFE